MGTTEEHPRPEPPLDGDEVATLLGFLEFHRATLAWKTGGLDARGLAAPLHPTTMTLAGLLKHLAYVEERWFGHRLLGRAMPPPFDGVDHRADPDWEWRTAPGDDPEQLRAWWSAAVDRSRAAVDEALADGGLERVLAVPLGDGTTPSLRWVLVHMIEEYARHNGHADLLRENVDGRTGE